MTMGDSSKDVTDFYSVLGLQKSCSVSEVRIAYKKLAMKWHPDKCSAGDSTVTEQAKKKFQAIQAAYSVLSDDKKRFLYDAGLLDASEEEESGTYGMADFMGEMATLMAETKAQATGTDNFEELKDLFMKMFGEEQCMAQKKGFTDIGAFPTSKRSWTGEYFMYPEMHISGRDFSNAQTPSFCMGSNSDSSGGSRRGKKRNCRKQKFDNPDTTSMTF